MIARPAYTRKIGAAFLLGMFLFIHAEKSFHKHKEGFVRTTEAATLIKSVNAGCSICEFQATKDADLPVPLSQQAPVILHHHSYVSFVKPLHSVFQGLISDRGPPALL